MSDHIPKDEKDELHSRGHVEVHHAEVLANPDLMNDAFEGENLEHEMGVWTAVKAHPWACLWAFIMCFTIVSLFPALSAVRIGSRKIIRV